VQRNYTHGVPVNDVVIHPNQGELISCDRGGNVRIWDLGENKCSHQLIPEDDVSVASVTVASDGSMVCAGNNAVSAIIPCQIYRLTNTQLGKCICMAHDPATRYYFNHPRMQIRRTLHLHNPRPPVPGRPTPRYLQRRPHRAHLVPRHFDSAQPATWRSTAYSSRARPRRISPRNHTTRPPALGLGLRFLSRQRILGDSV
jgi:hypothetical protein